MKYVRMLFHRAPADFLLASEEVITKAVGLGISPPTVRVNVFDPPAVLVGYNQDVYEEVNVEEALKLGFSINRRPSGGGTILMYWDTPGWEIWLPSSHLSGMGIEQIYEELSKIPLAALKYLGIEEVRFRGKNDIEVRGRKISGTGLYSDFGGLMFCGTILLDFNARLMLNLLKLPVEKISDKDVKTFEERIITAREILGSKPTIERVVEAFRNAVSDVLGVDAVDGDLSEWELEEVQRATERYRSSDWIYGQRSTGGKTFTRVCRYKTQAGLLRVHVKVYEGVVEQLMLTGDFFVYPHTALHELEAQLKWVAVESIPNILAAFRGRIAIHGLSIDELNSLIKKCVEGS
ncbi:MAG: biotin/lipoate A/B protein ligase family protein [Ignisphaera sp.]|nr:lipoate--protein ligase family protein [Ignisphaera sp.]MDW8085581.1 biotin/lipoate A/B protein ligase family protein [Ignisphaera sp.]